MEDKKDKNVDESFRRKRIKIIVFVLIFLIFSCVGIFLMLSKYRTALVVARVNNQFVTRYELNKKVVGLYGARVLEDLITAKLVEQELENQNIEVSDSEIDNKIKQIEESLGGLSLEEAMNAQGLTIESLREQVAMQVGVEKLLTDRVEISQEEVDEFLDTYGFQSEGATEEERRAQAADALIKQKMQEVINNWIIEIRAEAKIVKYL